MLGSHLLEVLIALIFVYLLLSLGVSTIVEIIAQLRSLRAKKLQSVIKELLNAKFKQVEQESSPDTGSLGDKFYKHSIIKNFGKLTKKKIPFLKTQLPSYLTANNFSTVIIDLLIKEQENKNKDSDKSNEQEDSLSNKLPSSTNINYKDINLKSLIDDLDNSDLKDTLETFLKSANDDIEVLKKKIENWYNDTMVRFTGYYKRHTKLWLFIIGLLLCIVLNADTFFIIDKLSKDPETRLALVEQATQYVKDHQNEFAQNSNTNDEQGEKSNGDDVTINTDSLKQKANDSEGKKFLQNLDSLRRNIISDDLKQASTWLGMGWNDEEFKNLSIKTPDKEISFWSLIWIWILKIVGILITTLAIYLGAPFWFDILNKFVNLRSAGKKPDGKDNPSGNRAA